MKNNRVENFFLKLLIHRERRRPELRRLVIRVHATKESPPMPVPVNFIGRRLNFGD